MKLLTFLGVGNYVLTKYSWQGKTHTSKYAPVASCHFLQPDCLTVFLTEEAEEIIYPEFKQEIPGEITIVPRSVPLGQNEAELWLIFAQISKSVQPGECVAFDITHGLRAFPYLGLLSAAFLRAGLDVHLEAVLYGAFDVRDQSVSPNRAPMFDLSPMLRLLEWATATDRFNRTGDSRYLASLLKEDQKTMAITSAGDHQKLQEIGDLGRLGSFIEGLTSSLRCIRTFEVLEDTEKMISVVDQARPLIQDSAPLQPFAMLLDKVVETYSPLQVESLPEGQQVIASLQTQRNLINWYYQREQWPEAASLAREWIVSWVMVQSGENDILGSQRSVIERKLGSEGARWISSKKNGKPFRSKYFAGLIQVENKLDLWNQVSNIRNDFLHAGYRKHPSSPHSLVQKLGTCIDKINQVPLGLG